MEEAYLLGICFIYNFDKYKYPRKSDKVKFVDTEVEFNVMRDKSGQVKSVSVVETYIHSGGTVTLTVTDLGNAGAEIKTIYAAP